MIDKNFPDYIYTQGQLVFLCEAAKEKAIDAAREQNIDTKKEQKEYIEIAERSFWPGCRSST